MRALRILLVGSCLVGLFSACSGESGSGAEAEPEPVPLDSLRAELVNALCSNTECCTRVGRSYAESFCREVMLDGLPSYAPNARLSYDAEQARRCVDQVREAVVSCGMPDYESGECAGVFVGNVTIGGACDTSDECAGADVLCDNGVCAAMVHQVAGGSCADTCEESATGVSCRLGSRIPVCFRGDGLRCTYEGQCVALVPADRVCYSDLECEAGLVCADGKCVPAAEQPCGGACPSGLVCDEGSGSCVPNGQPGEACTYDSDCTGGCFQGKCQLPGLLQNSCRD
ncbi:MAG: hypothetical protein R3B07_24885 [Polyangiaceae bacterium]